MCQPAVLLEALKDLHNYCLACTWGERITQRAALIIAGNLLHANQGVDVIVPRGLLEGALRVQKCWRLGKEDPKGTKSGILDTGSGVWPCFAMVRQQSEVSGHDALEGIEA
jgi:hypothetical protein